MFLLVNSLMGSALATPGIDPSPKSFVTESLVDTIAESPLIFEASVTGVNTRIWLGPVGDATGDVYRLNVLRTFKGSIESGWVDYWDGVGFSELEVGQAVIVFGGPKVAHLSTHEAAAHEPFVGVPPFGDTVVPTWTHSIVIDPRPADVPDMPRLCFVGDGMVHNGSLGLGGYCHPTHWTDLIDYIQSHVVDPSGISIPGATVAK